MPTPLQEPIAAGPRLHADVAFAGVNVPPPARYDSRMFESFVTAFIIYFVGIDLVSNAPIFLALTEAKGHARRHRHRHHAVLRAMRGVDPTLSQHHRGRVKIAGGIILLLVALDMLAAKRQQHKRDESTGGGNTGKVAPGSTDTAIDNLAIYPLATPLAGPSAIMSVIVVNAGFAGALASTLTGYAALLAVMLATGIILCLTVVAEGLLNEKITMVFSRITAIILASLSVQYVIDGLTAIGIVSL